MQVGELIGLDLGDPPVETVAVQPAHDLGERRDMAGDGVQVRAAGQDLLALELLVGVEAVGVAQQPARQVANLGRRGRAWRCAAQLAEWTKVVADDASAAAVALGADLLEQTGGAGVAIAPALEQVGLELVEDAGPSLAGLGQQLLHTGGTAEAAHGLFGQAELAHHRLDALARGAERLHSYIPLPGALDQNGALSAFGGDLDKVDSDGRVRRSATCLACGAPL